MNSSNWVSNITVQSPPPPPALAPQLTIWLIYVDLVGNKIYESCLLTYIVANDPEEKKIKIPAFGKIFLVEEGQDEAGKMERFEVYLDPSEVFKRIQEFKKEG